MDLDVRFFVGSALATFSIVTAMSVQSTVMARRRRQTLGQEDFARSGVSTPTWMEVGVHATVVLLLKLLTTQHHPLFQI